jgi:hypothetical protein
MELTPMCLRVEDPDGRTVAEYRIRGEEVEVRHLPLSTHDEYEWYRLTAEDLSSHVSRNTAVAQWLTRRLGWRRLLRLCLSKQSQYVLDMTETRPDRRAA